MFEKIITCVGVYPDGSKVFNGVLESDLKTHIEYNKTFRPGRALFVDGECVHEGQCYKDRISIYKEEIKDIKINKCTRPYS